MSEQTEQISEKRRAGRPKKYKDHAEYLQDVNRRMKEYYANNPEKRELNKKKTMERYREKNPVVKYINHTKHRGDLPKQIATESMNILIKKLLYQYKIQLQTLTEEQLNELLETN